MEYEKYLCGVKVPDLLPCPEGAYKSLEFRLGLDLLCPLPVVGRLAEKEPPLLEEFSHERMFA